MRLSVFNSCGRVSRLFVRFTNKSKSARNQTDKARSVIISRIAGVIKAPSPVEITFKAGGVSSNRSITRRSTRRNSSSPYIEKISTTLHPAAASISLSESTKGIPNRRANARPTLVLPAPISPTITIGRSIKSSHSFNISMQYCIKKSPTNNKKTTKETHLSFFHWEFML